MRRMMRLLFSRRATALVLAPLGFVAGCASMPDVTINYRPVKGAVLVTVAHTITCDQKGELAIVDRGATFTPMYSAADPDPRNKIQLKSLSGDFADAEITLFLTDDGRLKSINQSSTGQGDTIVKSAIAAVATVAATPLVNSYLDKKQPDSANPPSLCQVVRKRSVVAPEKLPQVSLVQTVLIAKVGEDGISQTAQHSKDQDVLFEALTSAKLDLTVKVTAKLQSDELQPIFEPANSVASGEIPLHLQRMRNLQVSVTDYKGTIGSKLVPVPLKDTFVIPIPKAALFGKQVFALTLAESGRITSIAYTRTTGVPGALNAVTAVAGAETTEDNTAAAEMRAASDLIAQQQRYKNCRLKPTECK